VWAKELIETAVAALYEDAANKLPSRPSSRFLQSRVIDQ
jgi:hypothetical protein